MKIIQDPRGYQRVYGKPVHKTKYRCAFCGDTRLGFGVCNSCGVWVDKIDPEESVKGTDRR